jgi:ribosomal-protein-alanine N-acetyltransferase
MNLTLREAAEKDLEVIQIIESITYSKPWTLNFFKLVYHSNPGLFLIATDGKQIIGYVVGEIKPYRSTKDSPKIGHVMNLAVIPSYRNKGIGTTLMEKLENKFRVEETKRVYMEVRESNTKAQNLYFRLGYVFMGKIDNYYGNEDALILTKNIL